jgi:hypothetical protein
MTVRLYGRGRVVDLVGEGLRRKGVPDRQLPLVLLAGPHGSGGTALLDRLWARYGPDCLCAHLDLASAQGADDVVLAMMQGLGRKVSGIRPISFPRLRLAFKALNFPPDGGGRAAFDAYMDATDHGAADEVNGWANRASVLLRTPEQQFIAAVVARTASWLLSGFDHRGEKPALRWHAENGISSGGSGYSPLWELFGRQRAAANDVSRHIEKTLCAALLADLRTDFNARSLAHGQRRANCLLLLDNAGGNAGERVLDLLAECRRDNAKAGHDPDPALIVAVLRGRMLRRAGTPIASTDERLWFGNPTAYPDGWLPVRLTDLTAPDVVDLTSSGLLGDGRRDADFVHALTGGHPEATALLAMLLARPRMTRADLSGLLERELPIEWDVPGPRVPDALDIRVTDHLLQRIFPGRLNTGKDGKLDANPLLDAMAVCTVTPGLRLGACQKVLNAMGWKAATAIDVRSQLEEALWITPPPTPDSTEPRAHPLLSLLLRHWLARDTQKWRGVHQGYMAHYSRPQDAVLRHHHALALVEPRHSEPLADVARFLDEDLERSDPRDWLEHLRTVTGAPNRVRGPGDPRALVTTLAGPTQPGERRRVITRLAVLRWLNQDRLCDPGWLLAQLIAIELENLAQLLTPEDEALFEEAARWRHIARMWEDPTC